MARSLPRTSHLLLVLVAAAVLPPLTAQAWTIEYGNSGGPVIRGSGKVAQQVRQVGSFSKLRLDGPFNVDAKPGPAIQVTIEADDNLADMIETVVEGDTLVVRDRPRMSWRASTPIVIHVLAPQLHGAELRGSGNLVVRQLQTDRFSAALSGSGDLRLESAQLGSLSANLAGSGDLNANGTSQQVDISLAGSGDIDLTKLKARQAKVKLAGSGDIKVHASESVDVSIAGSGDVEVWGKPARVNRKVVGSGDIHLR